MAGKSSFEGFGSCGQHLCGDVALFAKTVELGGDALRGGIKGFASQFATLMDGVRLEGGTAVIDETELSLTVSANGGVELLGKLTAGAQASIKVKLKRKS